MTARPAFRSLMILILGLAALVFQGGACANGHVGADAPHCPEAPAMHHDAMAAAAEQGGAPAQNAREGSGHHETDSDTLMPGHSCGTVCHPPAVGVVAPLMSVPMIHSTAPVAALEASIAGIMAPPATPPPRAG
jgi:hypothetical protein